MGNIHDAVNFALAQQGKPYHAYGNRFGPDYFDCSGLMKASCTAAGIWTPDYATNSSGFYNWGAAVHGAIISVDQAIHTYGAMLIKGDGHGYGPLGHICFSLGDGRTMEAMGSAYGCRIGNAWNRGFSSGLIVPGADYLDPLAEALAAAAAYAAKKHEIEALQAIAAAIKSLHQVPMHTGDKRKQVVRFVKALLNSKFHAGCIATDGTYPPGSKMEHSIKAFQASRHLKADGVIGAKTIDALVKS